MMLGLDYAKIAAIVLFLLPLAGIVAFWWTFGRNLR